MATDDAIEIRLPDLARIALEPGEAIWVRVRQPVVTQHDAARIEHIFKRKLPGHEVIVTDDAVELAAVRPATQQHDFLGRVAGVTGITSLCSCGHSFYGQDVEEADRRFDAHRSAPH